MLDFSSLTLCPFPPSWPNLVLYLSFHMFCLLWLVKLFSTFFLYNFLSPHFSPFSFLTAFSSYLFLFYSSSILSSISASVIFFPTLQISCTSGFFFFFFFLILFLFSSVVSIQISHSLALLNLSLSSLALQFFYLIFAFFLLVLFFFFLYFFFNFISKLHQCDDFLSFSCHFPTFSHAAFHSSFLSAAVKIQQSFSCS